jgi:hypothetical protein
VREFAKVCPGFWTGETGRLLRQRGRDAQLVALYLVTGPSANMIGLYHLALPLLCHHTGLSPDEALAALRALSEAPSEGLGSPFEAPSKGGKGGFAYYDEATEEVWVPEMACFQIGPTLAQEDNRVKGVARELLQFRKSKYFNEFMRRYGEAYHLADRPELKPLGSPFEGASKPLRSQEQEQEIEQEFPMADELHANGTANGKPRKRNELWDAVVEITGADQTIPRAAGHIGKVVKELKAARPPYTPAEVRALPEAIRRAGYDFAITVGSIPNHIHLTRAKPRPPAGDALFQGLKDT